MLALWIAWLALGVVEETALVVELPFDRSVPYLDGSDFPAFYAGSRLFTTSPSRAYDQDSQLRAVLRAKGYEAGKEQPGSQWYRYYNPPIYSLLLAPLTLLDLQTAFAVTLLLNVLGLACLVFVLSRILAGRPLVFAFFAAGVATSAPVDYAFWHAQPTLYLAAAAGLALLGLQRRQHVKAGLVWALLLIKPHWLLAPLLPAATTARRWLKPLAVAMAVLCLPFLALGLGGLTDYASLLLNRGQGDVRDSSFAEAVLSWSGFLRALTGEPQPVAWLALSAVSLLAAVGVAVLGSRRLVPLASCLGLLLVVPHSHPQDWIMIAPAAAILLREETDWRRLAVTATLLAWLQWGMDGWSGLANSEREIYWPTVSAFCLLLWCGVLALSSRGKALLLAEHPSFALATSNLLAVWRERAPVVIRVKRPLRQPSQSGPEIVQQESLPRAKL